MAGTDFGGWTDLAAQRRAEDEALVQRYAGGTGRGLDMRPVSGFVRHVRRDIGAKAIIWDVAMTTNGRDHEIVVWYYFPHEGTAARPRTTSVTDVRMTGNGRAPSTSTESAGGPASLGALLRRAPGLRPPRPCAR